MEIKSVILAAGKGTRMKSETPKVLHKIFDKTLLGYVLDSVITLLPKQFCKPRSWAQDMLFLWFARSLKILTDLF